MARLTDETRAHLLNLINLAHLPGEPQEETVLRLITRCQKDIDLGQECDPELVGLAGRRLDTLRALQAEWAEAQAQDEGISCATAMEVLAEHYNAEDVRLLPETLPPAFQADRLLPDPLTIQDAINVLGVYERMTDTTFVAVPNAEVEPVEVPPMTLQEAVDQGLVTFPRKSFSLASSDTIRVVGNFSVQVQ